MVDRMAIDALFVRYATALDDGEVASVIGCYRRTRALESPVIGRIEGTDAIRAFAETLRGAARRRHAVPAFDHQSRGRDRAGGEQARATAYLLVMISKDGQHSALPRADTSANSQNRMVPGGSPGASCLMITPTRSTASETGRGARWTAGGDILYKTALPAPR